MNAVKTSLPPLPKFFEIFATEGEAKSHCKRFGAHPLVEKVEGGWTPMAYASQRICREEIAKQGILNSYAMGLRTGNITRWAVGFWKGHESEKFGGADKPSPVVTKTTPAPGPVASGEGKRMTGATVVCKQIAAERPDTLASKEAFIAACAEHGVIAATAGTQWYRLRKK